MEPQTDTATRRTLSLGGHGIELVGTAHVSAESIAEVTAAIGSVRPDVVAVELDEKRLENMRDPEAWRKMDIIKVMRDKQAFLMMANLVLSSYQKRMGQGAGVRPGDEMMAALVKAEELGIPQVTVDRSISVTLRRAWAKNSLWGKCKLLSVLVASAFSKEEVAPEQIEGLKRQSEMDSMMAELSEYLPAVKQVLIDERDRFLACRIWQACEARAGGSVLAVLGAGHLKGVAAHLEAIAAGTEDADCADIADVPPKGLGAKIAVWVLPALIVALIAAGFVFGGASRGWDMLSEWVLWNGVLAAAGAVIALAHPLVVLVALVGAPFTSLCPFVGIGLLTGVVQAVIRKPKVEDMENIQEDAHSLRGIYRNRILRVLLVFVLSTIGSSAGTIIAGASFVHTVSGFFGKIVAAVKGLFGR